MKTSIIGDRSEKNFTKSMYLRLTIPRCGYILKTVALSRWTEQRTILTLMGSSPTSWCMTNLSPMIRDLMKPWNPTSELNELRYLLLVLHQKSLGHITKRSPTVSRDCPTDLTTRDRRILTHTSTHSAREILNFKKNVKNT
jgi:hypothetical protein